MNKDETRVTIDQLLAMSRQTVVRQKRERFIDEAHSLLAVSDLLAWIDKNLNKNTFGSEEEAFAYVAGYMNGLEDAGAIKVINLKEAPNERR